REDRVRDAVRRRVPELAEEEREDDHQEERLQDGPRDPENGLLVADENVPPGEDEQQLATGPELAKREPPPAAGRLDHERLAFDLGGHRAEGPRTSGRDYAGRRDVNLRRRIHYKLAREHDLALLRIRHGRTLRPLGDGTGPPALVVSLTEFIYQLKLEAMLAKAFELEGYTPVFLVQPGSKTASRYLRAFGIRRFVSLDEHVDDRVEATARRETD